MAFARGNQLATVRNRNATYRVVEQQVVPTVYYSLLKVQEQET